jgi:hypothetical protein
MLSGHAVRFLTFHSVSSTSAPPPHHRHPGTLASEAHPQTNAQPWLGHCGDQGIASVRLAYGYAQYGYTQRKYFVCVTNGSAGEPPRCTLAATRPLLTPVRYGAIMDGRMPPSGTAETC